MNRINFITSTMVALAVLAGGCSDSSNKTVAPSTLSISGGTLPLAIAQHTYFHTVEASGGALNYEFELDHALMPPGITAEWDNNDLVIRGTGTQAGSYTVPVTVIDADKDEATTTLVINVAADNNIAGNWNLVITVTLATQDCTGEEGEYPAVPVTIIQNGSSLTVSGFLGDGSISLDGSIGGVNGNVVTIAGSFPEEGGTTTVTHTWSLISLTHMSGTEDWSWTDGQDSCPGSKSTVVLTR